MRPEELKEVRRQDLIASAWDATLEMPWTCNPGYQFTLKTRGGSYRRGSIPPGKNLTMVGARDGVRDSLIVVFNLDVPFHLKGRDWVDLIEVPLFKINEALGVISGSVFTDVLLRGSRFDPILGPDAAKTPSQNIGEGYEDMSDFACYSYSLNSIAVP